MARQNNTHRNSLTSIMQWRNSTSKLTHGILHCWSTVNRHCLFLIQKRISTYSTILAECNFEIRYRKTTDFGQADGLSWLIANYETPMEQTVIANIAIERDTRSIMAEFIRNIPVRANEILLWSAKDSVIKKALITYKGNELHQQFKAN